MGHVVMSSMGISTEEVAFSAKVQVDVPLSRINSTARILRDRGWGSKDALSLDLFT